MQCLPALLCFVDNGFISAMLVPITCNPVFVSENDPAQRAHMFLINKGRISALDHIYYNYYGH